MKDAEFEFRRIRNDGNSNRFSELMFASFGKKADETYFKWKYFDNPAGELIAFEAIHDGKTVGFYGIIPELYNLNGQIERVYQSMDTMTHPDFQRRGLFVKLAKMTYADAIKQDGKLLIVGFPGDQSYGGFIKKLEWKTIKENCRYIFVPRPLFNMTRIFSPIKNAKIRPFSEMTGELVVYLSRIDPLTKISKFFDEKIFQWKIFDNPNYDYKVIGIIKNDSLSGVCVYRIGGLKSCEISWVNFLDQTDYKTRIRNILKHIFDETKIRYIYTWEPQPKDLAEAYKKSGFIVNTLSKGPFNTTFPLIIYENGFSAETGTEDFNNYEFQPLLLD